MTTALVHTVVTGLLLALTAQALLKARTMIPRRGATPAPPSFPRIAVMVPARTEADRIGASIMT